MRLLRQARDLGVNFFDTADVYGGGKGEVVLAQAFEGRRDDIVIATKFGYDFYNHPGVQPGQRERPHNWTPDFIRMACEKSLGRLKTDHIDFYPNGSASAAAIGVIDRQNNELQISSGNTADYVTLTDSYRTIAPPKEVAGP